MAQIREGIHLVQLGGQIPLNEFHKAVVSIYLDLQPKIEQAVIETLSTVEITTSGIDLEKEGLKGPSATWTYMINDTPFGSKLEMVLSPLLKKLFKKEGESVCFSENYKK